MKAADDERVALALKAAGEAVIQWDSFGRCWSVWKPTALGVEALFLEIGPRAYNSPRWEPR